MEQIVLGDGQRIHIVGMAKGRQMRELANQYTSLGIADYDGVGSDTARLQDRMARKYIAIYNHNIWDWLEENNALSVGWVDPMIFDRFVPGDLISFRYGIGFPPGDPLESLFVLRWS
jgi:hypothetical protein